MQAKSSPLIVLYKLLSLVVSVQLWIVILSIEGDGYI